MSDLNQAVEYAAKVMLTMNVEQARMVKALCDVFKGTVEEKNERIAILEADIETISMASSGGCDECGMHGAIIACSTCNAHRECRSGGY